jgi:predicted dehydrogenase
MELGFGLIGCGTMGRELGTAITDEVADSVLIAAFDPYEANMRQLCDDCGAAPAASSEELLARADVQAVIIASPNNMHREQTVAAAKAGKHVFCEKPMALSVADCDAMIAACRAAGVKLMVGHNMRLHPLVRKLLEVTAGGELGRALFAFTSYFFSGFKDRPSGIWHLDRSNSGGLLFHMSIHQIDLLQAVLGPARRLQYVGGRYGNQVHDFHDICNLLIEFSSGTTATLVASSISPVHWLEATFLFTDGFVRLASPWSYLEYGQDEEHLVRVEPKEVPGPKAVPAELSSFVRWVLFDERPVFTASEGRAAVAVAEAAEEAEASGEWAFVQP